MCRTIKGKVHGVLTDYDLSFWKVSQTTDHARDSQRIFGTPPYMASELLKRTRTTHTYRHDDKSLFYVMFIMCGHHTIGHTGGEGTDGRLRAVTRSGKLPYQTWFEAQGHTLGCVKGSFIFGWETIELSPPFEDFRMWLEELQCLFLEGFYLQFDARFNRCARCRAGLVPFDDETLEGCVDYSTLIELTHHGARRAYHPL